LHFEIALVLASVVSLCEVVVYKLMASERGPLEASKFWNYEALARAKCRELLGGMSAAQIKLGIFRVEF
jgi:hypothetical protein